MCAVFPLRLRTRRPVYFIYATEKSVAATVNCFDKARLLRVIAKRQAQVVDVFFDLAFRNAYIAPNSIQDLVFRQKPVGIANQESKQLKSLVAELNGLIAIP